MSNEITTTISIDMGHRVPNHNSKCRTPHGHRYKIIAHCEGEIITEKGHSSEGMLIDFTDLKTIMMNNIDKPDDHCGIFYSGEPQKIKDAIEVFYSDCPKQATFVDFIPTAENLAKYWAENIMPEIEDHFGNYLKLTKLVVWETPNNSATYIVDESKVFPFNHPNL